jgi:predicted RNA-binding Zn-ribbon protein involved in translation (DUF1610 family)
LIENRKMPINMNCPSCNKTLSAPDTAAGKKAKCPACGQIMTVPEVIQEAEEFSAPQPSTPFSPQPPAGSAENWLDAMQGPAAAATPPGAGGEARRPCPECGEMIMVGAAKCRFCNAIFDPHLKLTEGKRHYAPGDENLSTGDWIFCILCAGIACIFGIVYAIQGKPKGMKMVGISFAAAVVWNILNAILQVALHAPNQFR